MALKMTACGDLLYSMRASASLPGDQAQAHKLTTPSVHPQLMSQKQAPQRAVQSTVICRRCCAHWMQRCLYLLAAQTSTRLPLIVRSKGPSRGLKTALGQARKGGSQPVSLKELLGKRSGAGKQAEPMVSQAQVKSGTIS